MSTDTELPPCDCTDTGLHDGTWGTTCDNCKAMELLGTDREEWARLQGCSDRCREIDGAGFSSSMSACCVSRWERSCELETERDAERIRADKAEADSEKWQWRCNEYEARAHRLGDLYDRKEAELEAKLTEARDKLKETKS